MCPYEAALLSLALADDRARADRYRRRVEADPSRETTSGTARAWIIAVLALALVALIFAPIATARPHGAPPESDARAAVVPQVAPHAPLHRAPPEADAQASPGATPEAVPVALRAPGGFDVADSALAFGLGAALTLIAAVAIGRRRRSDVGTARVAS